MCQTLPEKADIEGEQPDVSRNSCTNSKKKSAGKGSGYTMHHETSPPSWGNLAESQSKRKVRSAHVEN